MTDESKPAAPVWRMVECDCGRAILVPDREEVALLVSAARDAAEILHLEGAHMTANQLEAALKPFEEP